ncbi:MAG: glycogen-binding domain-containing protein [Gemmatimonadota bacterium]|nr:glycogen-binding domain-containing protein [Gemmatimonadota bacterium]HEU4989899.1 glycogen-binding domain-containing protein [Gemmatimonadaceae bacterium]
MFEPTKRNAALPALLLALALPQSGISAQVSTRLQAGAVMSAAPGLVPANALSLTPDVRYHSQVLSLAASGSAWLDGNSWEFADGDATATVTTPTRHHLSAQLIANASREYYDRINQNDQIDARARVHLVFSQQGGMWLESGVARPWRVAVVSSVDVAGAGAWTQVGGATITGTYTNFSFTKIGSASDSNGTLQSCANQADNSRCLRQSHFSDVQGTVHWEKSSVELNAQTGYRFGDANDVTPDSRRWASASAVVWLSPDMAMVVGGGRQPANPARGLPARNYANLGVMFSAWPAMTEGAVPIESRASAISQFDIAAAGASLQRIQVHIAGVQTVEVMGDFTDWQPIDMVQRGRDLWEALLPIASGVHQLNVRVDGGKWQPPPNTPTMRDGFNGEVGVLVIRR